MDMTDTIVAKSDQLNADDLLGRELTITVTKVSIPGGEQPVTIHYDGDGGKPYRPGKSMRRVLVKVWGPDANAYVGRSMTLYRDDEVVFGGLRVGGIRISHMSHTDKAQTMALTATRGNKKPFTVKPLAVEPEQPKKLTFRYLDQKLAECRTRDEVFALVTGDPLISPAKDSAKVKERVDARLLDLSDEDTAEEQHRAAELDRIARAEASAP